MSENVLADAQFTVATVLRPFEGFEFVYQGQLATIPIVFPGTLDEDAGRPGFSPYLLKGHPVPLGSKVQIWFPAVAGLDEGGLPAFDYRYLLIWRMRNVGDFQRRQRPYHLSKESFGAPDTLLAPSQPNRFVIPAASETVIYQQPEAVALPPLLTAPSAGQGNLRTELIDVPSDLIETFPFSGLPLLPPNAAPPFASPYPSTAPGNTTPLGAFQQGVIDPRNSDSANSWLFRPYFTVAKGDELIIACGRNNPSPDPNWNFTGTDFQFSNLYGTNAFPPVGTTSHKPFPDLGIYVLTGSNPS